MSYFRHAPSCQWGGAGASQRIHLWGRRWCPPARAASEKRALVRDAWPGFLHRPKKPFALKAARCDLSTVQVVVHTYRLHFCLGPQSAFFCNSFNAFDTRDRSGSTLPDPICSHLTLILHPMTASELPPNMQEFNEITAVIFSQLFIAFPVARNINPDEVATVLGLANRRHQMPSGRPFNEVFASTLDWLINEEFVRSLGTLSAERVVLRTKAIAVMNVVPPSLSQPLGSELADATKQASTEGGKRKITELMGNFFGSFIGSFSKTIAG